MKLFIGIHSPNFNYYLLVCKFLGTFFKNLLHKRNRVSAFSIEKWNLEILQEISVIIICSTILKEWIISFIDFL